MTIAVSSVQNLDSKSVLSASPNALKRKRVSLDSETVKVPKTTTTSTPGAPSPVAVRRLSGQADVKQILITKEAKFFSATKYAVVGASDDSTKWGHKVMAFLLGQGKDVVPVNPNRESVLGKACIKTIKDLPDPAHTSVSIVVPPKVTLQVLKQAKDVGVSCIWLQPGAEDDAVLDFIKESGLEERCIHRQAGSKPVGTPTSVKTNSPQILVGPICSDGVANPSVDNSIVATGPADLKSSTSSSGLASSSGKSTASTTLTAVEAPCILKAKAPLSTNS